MNDLINGREMLNRYQADLCYGIACKDCSMCTEDGGCRVEEWIDTFPSADRQQEWIPCSERMPSDYSYYLVIDDDGEMAVGNYRDDADAWDNACFGWLERDEDDEQPSRLGKVVAWMPLPKPWEGADNGDN